MPVIGGGSPGYPCSFMRPLIGVTTSGHQLANRVDNDRVYLAFVTYVDMVRAAGGIPVALVPGPPDEADDLLDRIDGLLLSGGGDIEPARYGGAQHDTVYGVDPARDVFEIELISAAQRRHFPTLCICRGMQVANVAFGGTLIADIASEGPGFLDHRRISEPAATLSHTVDIEPGTSTAIVTGAGTIEVNSLHHQAVRDLAPSLRITGRSPDGVIEAVAPADADWPMWAVQWHPESLGTDNPVSMALFDALVDAADVAARSRSSRAG